MSKFIKTVILTATFLVILKVSNATKSNFDYCKIENTCRDYGFHPMCRYQESQPGFECPKDAILKLKQCEKRLILNLHNKLRRRVANGEEMRGNPGPQPAAKFMPDLIWDDELAEIAQRWANQCHYNHACGNAEHFPYVGQNIARRGSYPTTPKVKDLVMLWENEVANYNKNDVSKFKYSEDEREPVVGHYTQMVWAKTTHIGCGVAKYFDKVNKVYLVCNYGPGGNYRDQSVYEQKYQ